jgi:uncharacterized protein (DUF1697 family)
VSVRGTRRVAFLRAINVGGHTVTMDRLRRLFEGLGFGAVETFIASGNVVFEAPPADRALLERRIAAALEKALGYEVATFVRTPGELAAVATFEAFPPAALAHARAHWVGFLSRPLGRAAAAKVMALRTEVDDFRVHGREVHWLCRFGQRDSEFSNAVLEKTIGAQATFRGSNTVRKMAAKYAAPGGEDAA